MADEELEVEVSTPLPHPSQVRVYAYADGTGEVRVTGSSSFDFEDYERNPNFVYVGDGSEPSSGLTEAAVAEAAASNVPFDEGAATDDVSPVLAEKSFEDMTFDELGTLLETRGLSKGGSKKDRIERLIADEDAVAAADEDGDD